MPDFKHARKKVAHGGQVETWSPMLFRSQSSYDTQSKPWCNLSTASSEVFT